VLNLYDLAPHLSANRPFYAFQARGLDGRTHPHLTIDAMAEEYLAELRAVQSAGPYFLSGYCGGGLVAYEMAQRLKADGEQVLFLGLIDLYRPGVPFKEARADRWIRQLREDSLREVVSKLKIKAKRDFVYHSGRLRVMLRTALRRTVPVDLRDVWLTQEFYLASSRYTLRPYDGRLAVFRARDGGYEFLEDPGPDLGWGALARQGIDAREIPGDHYTSMREPNVRVLAQQLEDAIGQAERPTGAPVEQGPLHRAG
jgi:thioesterase domain-containing protein